MMLLSASVYDLLWIFQIIIVHQLFCVEHRCFRDCVVIPLVQLLTLKQVWNLLIKLQHLLLSI